MEIGFYKDQFVDINENVVPIQERGHQFGDGVYEVIRVYNGKPFLLNEHLDRLVKSAEAIYLELPYPPERIYEIISEGLEKSGLTEAEIYMQITRGIAPRAHLFPTTPSVMSMTIKNARVVDKKKRIDGVTVTLMEDERWKNCYIKSLNLLPNVIAKQKAATNGHEEAIFIRDGFITEGSSSNIFIVKNGTLITTPATNFILHGITRAAVIKLASKCNIPFEERKFDREFLNEADEAFITSTSAEILPISKIDDISLSPNRPITNLLYNEYCGLYK
ncbi:D-amino-acid transaminase [Bacillus luteolus]|uniref:D-alanine aminotransferase n=2 Tax=Litchfieldia luteola TaxID=682179 RepID=A0ABR9QNN3_9BACI|nr:D-amino-acid transaminase [Cytobacillus luteolus]MBE4910102.1 D-amino-acid transaminase [Cytobacillus luteolus]MBP1942334.1 D-alanine transaminase [Cytobacillus luteolus]